MDNERSSMSRVADALRRANAIQSQPARTEEADTAPVWPSIKIDMERRVCSIVTDAREEAAPEDVGTTPPANSRGLKDHPLLRQRWVRRALRFAGIRTGAPALTCRGLTRVGQPCRGPAMANGFCRQHGGSRSGMLAETTRSLLQRLSVTR